MATSSSSSTVKNAGNRPGASMAVSTSISATAAMVPNTINGMRRPIRELHRSLSRPNQGSRNSASTLSSAMI